jgi:hypothetical protein
VFFGLYAFYQSVVQTFRIFQISKNGRITLGEFIWVHFWKFDDSPMESDISGFGGFGGIFSLSTMSRIGFVKCIDACDALIGFQSSSSPVVLPSELIKLLLGKWTSWSPRPTKKNFFANWKIPKRIIFEGWSRNCSVSLRAGFQSSSWAWLLIVIWQYYWFPQTGIKIGNSDWKETVWIFPCFFFFCGCATICCSF